MYMATNLKTQNIKITYIIGHRRVLTSSFDNYCLASLSNKFVVIFLVIVWLSKANKYRILIKFGYK